jgi:hypothetical protein
VKERPILFSGPMVRALLDGSKTQTRRIVKLPHNNRLGVWEPTKFGGPEGGRTAAGDIVPEQGAIWHTRTGDCLSCSHGQPGDRLWVRETFAHMYRGNAAPETRRAEDVVYRADGFTPDEYVYGSWKPSIHMPRWASRITLEVTGVRVERLQDISIRDAVAEGAKPKPPHVACSMVCPEDYLTGFRDLWNSINGPEAWNSNPWVWVVEFKRVTE